ncbi:hypothetical protein AVEN_149983-1 [Araneus ventricosus]|uniref:Uncharacterized protein n=1 Tax=Araneus ventricosus TaxID=182803 RepID=A0A4Y2N783_ARAVE|nr:hypothetical protein AVEN_149983-1 [Araneus ventricosus]
MQWNYPVSITTAIGMSSGWDFSCGGKTVLELLQGLHFNVPESQGRKEVIICTHRERNLTLTDIINSKVMANQEVEESVSEDEEIAVPNLPSSTDVRKALDVLRCTLEQRGGNTESYKNFYKLSDDVESLISNSANQTTIR